MKKMSGGVTVAVIAFVVSGCSSLGGGDSTSRTDEVTYAMAHLPYPWVPVAEASTSEYEVFRLRKPVGQAPLYFAYGGKRDLGEACPSLPELPRDSPASLRAPTGEASELLICFAHDGLRPHGSKKSNVERLRTANEVARELCEEAYGLVSCAD